MHQAMPINAADDNKDTPLHHEADSDLLTEDKLAAYLNNGANPLARNKQGLIPLQLAQQHAHQHNKGAIRMLKKATNNAQDEQGKAIARHWGMQIKGGFQPGTWNKENTKYTVKEHRSWLTRLFGGHDDRS